jgi:amino acid transporter
MSTPLTPTHPTTSGPDQRKISLDRRLAISFWGLLFILTGAIWLFPQQHVPEGSWLVGVGLALVAALWAYNGFHDMVSVAGEVRDPGRVLPRALLAGMGIVVVVYLAANAA